MIFGIDFGTTNSLAAIVERGRALSLTDRGQPHPSVVWYRGDEIIVGREARKHLDFDEGGAPKGFVRSPKMKLRQRDFIDADGLAITPRGAVAEVLKHLKRDAAIARSVGEGRTLDRAVMTIPVDFGGHERSELREAARMAGISVVQFVHEPAAALYGYLRSMSETERNRQLADLDGRSVIVFDWGGGTLDITLCKIKSNVIMQVANVGDNEIGGDEFDFRLRTLFRAKHAERHKLKNVLDLEQAGMPAKLLAQCELAKISLSRDGENEADVYISNYLKAEGLAKRLEETITREMLEEVSQDIVARGLNLIDAVLDRARLSRKDINLCLATGGMVNMPAIRNGLNARFPGCVPGLPHGDRIIAEGAAWIAHDKLRLTLSKPIEMLVADSSGRGTYHTLVHSGLELPMENHSVEVANPRLFCVDPRNGEAVIEIAKPSRIGAAAPTDPRETLCVASVPVDPNAAPLIERLECHIRIDHNYVAELTLRSSGRGGEARTSFHDLEFGLALPTRRTRDGSHLSDEDQGDQQHPGKSSTAIANDRSNITQRVNVAIQPNDQTSHRDLWRLVPGDIALKWNEDYFDNRAQDMSRRQQTERDFYIPCSTCGRLVSQIVAEGPVEKCRGRRCGTGVSPVRA